MGIIVCSVVLRNNKYYIDCIINVGVQSICLIYCDYKSIFWLIVTTRDLIQEGIGLLQ